MPEMISLNLRDKSTELPPQFLPKSPTKEGQSTLENKDPLQERMNLLFQSLEKDRSRVREAPFSPRGVLISDHDKIENQQIDIVEQNDGNLLLSFKLTEKYYNELTARVSKMLQDGEKGVSQGHIEYVENANKNSESKTPKTTVLNRAYVLEKEGFLIKIAIFEKNTYGDTDDCRSALGLVQILMPKDKKINSNSLEVAKKIQEIFNNILMMNDALKEPEPKAEKAYKKARYTWHHKIGDVEVPEDLESRLIRSEVFPNYFTFVEPGRHTEYHKTAKYIIHHTINALGTLPAIIKSGGLMSTHERYRRGLIVNGMSSREDLNLGGGDSVFTRITTLESLSDDRHHSLNDAVIFEPDLLDRTDWYSYLSDSYGSTRPESFKNRTSPEETIKTLRDGFYNGNEQMFRLGISTKKMKAILVTNLERAYILWKLFEDEGITEINGKPVTEFIYISKFAINMIKKLYNIPITKEDAETHDYYSDDLSKGLPCATLAEYLTKKGLGSIESNVFIEYRNIDDRLQKGLVNLGNWYKAYGYKDIYSYYAYQELSHTMKGFTIFADSQDFETYFKNYGSGLTLPFRAIPNELKEKIIKSFEDFIDWADKTANNIKVKKDDASYDYDNNYADRIKKDILETKTKIEEFVGKLKKKT